MSDAKAALRAISGAEPSDTAVGLPNIPAVPATDDYALTNFLQSAKLWMEKAMGAGLTGFATRSDLIRNGLLKTDENGNLVPGGGSTNLTSPPVPTGLTATGAMTNVLVEWDDPTSAYSNHGYTEIWAAETNDFSSAVMGGESGGFLFSHAVGEDSSRYYWIRFVSKAGIKGPFNSANGTHGQTAKNPQYLLDTLTGQLTESQLYADLASRIDLIDGAEALTGSVNARIKATNDALQAQINDLTNTPAYDNAVTYATGDIVQYNGGLYQATQTTTGNLPTNTTYWTKIGDYTSLGAAVADNTAQIAAINTVTSGSSSAAAQAIVGLQSRVTTAEGNITSNATAISNTYTKAQTDSAISGTSTSLTAAYTSADTTTLNSAKSYADTAASGAYTNAQAYVQSYAYSKAGADSAIATSASQLTASYQSADTTTLNSAKSYADTGATNALNSAKSYSDAAVASEATTRAGADAALSSTITSVSAVANAKNKTYRQSTQPSSGMTAGDVWFDTANSNRAYRYDGTSWVATDDTRIAANAAAITNEATARADGDTALSAQISTVSARLNTGGDISNAVVQAQTTANTGVTNAASAQATANSKVMTYFQTSAPVSGLTAGDLWFDTDDNNRAYRYNGTSWVDAADVRITTTASQVNTIQTTVNGHTASIQTQGTSIDGLQAQYTVKTDVGGLVSGYGLASQVATLSGFAASGVSWSKVATGISRAAAGYTTESTVWKEYFSERMLGDVDNTGTVTASDSTIIQNYASGSLASLTADQISYIEGTLKPRLMAEVYWSKAVSSLNLALSYSEPDSTLWRTTYDGRMLGDIDNTGTLSSTDVTYLTYYANGQTGSLTADQIAYIEGVIRPKLNKYRKYAAYLVDVDWSKVAAGISRAASNLQPDAALWKEYFSGRMLGDVDNTGTVTASDASYVTSYHNGALSSLSSAQINYIEEVIRPTLLANGSKYAAYFGGAQSDSSASSMFGVSANQFFISPPALYSATEPSNKYKGLIWVDTSVTPNVKRHWTGTEWSFTPQRLPFIVQATDTVIDGVTIPAGVHLDAAYIVDGAITTAQIKNATIDAAKITGLLEANQINGNSLVVVDGTFSGSLQGATGTFSGSLQAATGTFTGSLSAATGTFAGRLAAGVLDPSAFSGTTYTYSTPGYYVVTVPDLGGTSTSMRITLLGAGGGGGGGASSSNVNYCFSGGGGGAGSLVTVTISGVTPGAQYGLTVGSGGAGGTVSGGGFTITGGSAGGSTSMAGYVASGGGGGGKGDPYSWTQGTGGSIGGEAGQVSWMGDPAGAKGGRGGSSAYGAGGGPDAGGGVGAGGGGASAGPGDVDRNGAAGGNGYASIEFFDPNTVILRNEYEAYKTSVQSSFNSTNAALAALVYVTDVNISHAGYSHYLNVYKSNGTSAQYFISSDYVVPPAG